VSESAPAQDSEMAAPPAKVDPETLALRARPPRAQRFRRGAIVGIAAVVSTGLVATAWVALQPSAVQIAGGERDDIAAAKNAPTDALASLPKTYGEVPKLGPPLPGDLGRPILRKQQMTMATEEGASSDVSRTVNEERDRSLAERRAALESPLLVRSTSPSGAPSQNSSTEPPLSQPFSPPTTIDVPREINSQQRKADFVAGATTAAINPHRIEQAQSPYTISAGSVIAASLITGLRSDLPGLVTAQVSERVYDSATGSILLIPQGARLIGSYDSVVAFGQRRALIVWQRLILPDGASLTIENVPATDPSGFSGLADQVDFHTWSLLKGAALSTLLGVGSNLTFSGESDLVQAIRESTQQNASRVGDQLVSRNLSIQPTITIRPGAPVRLVVHRDLVLRPWNP
jgi:type IV secretion system protein TrbI